MELTIRQPDLAAALAPAGLCPTNPRIPIAAAVLLDADRRLTVRASDFDQWATATAPAQVTEPGQVAVSGRLLQAVVRVIPKTATVELSAGDELAVEAGRGSWRLPVLAHDLMPAVPAADGKLGTVDGAALAGALGRITPFVSAEPALGIDAVYLHAGQRLTLAATDRYRLAVAELDWNPVAEAELYVPVAAAKAWLDLAKTGATLTLTGGEQPVRLAGLAGEGMASTTRLNAEFPNWRTLDKPAQTYPTTALVDVAEAQWAVNGTLAVAETRKAGAAMDPVLLTIDAAGLQLAGSGKGTATQHATVHAFHGDPVRLGIDPAKLAAALAALDSPQAVLAMHSQGMRPVLVRPAADDQVLPGYRHLVMPMRPPAVPS